MHLCGLLAAHYLTLPWQEFMLLIFKDKKLSVRSLSCTRYLGLCRATGMLYVTLRQHNIQYLPDNEMQGCINYVYLR